MCTNVLRRAYQQKCQKTTAAYQAMTGLAMVVPRLLAPATLSKSTTPTRPQHPSRNDDESHALATNVVGRRSNVMANSHVPTVQCIATVSSDGGRYASLHAHQIADRCAQNVRTTSPQIAGEIRHPSISKPSRAAYNAPKRFSASLCPTSTLPIQTSILPFSRSFTRENRLAHELGSFKPDRTSSHHHRQAPIPRTMLSLFP